MANLDQIQRLCEEYIGRKFGKRDKKDLNNFLRGLQGRRVGDSDDEQEKEEHAARYADTRTSQPRATPPTVETPAVVSKLENTPIARKATAFIGTVTEAYAQSQERAQPVKVADFDDIEGVKNRQKKWEEGQVIGSEGLKPGAEGYKLDTTEELKARKDKWEQGQVIGAEGIKAAAEGYKLDETEEVKARKNKWEGGQVIGAEGIKQPVEGYKLESAEEIKARKDKWEQGQVIGAAGTSTFQTEGYKLGESSGVKDRLNKWSQVASNVPVAKVDRKPELEVDSSKERRKQWEEGTVGKDSGATPTKTPIKVAEGDVDNVKDRLNKWSEVTKDPEPSPTRKEPVKIYDDQQQ
jgi:hypothetical protein